MRAFLTGGRGFVGGYLAEHLRALGDTVAIGPPDLDVTKPASIAAAMSSAKPDVVYHLAALSHVGESWRDPAEVFQVNALGTLQVLEAARGLPEVPKVLLVSSSEVYGPVPEHRLPITETERLSPVTPYAASKVAAEFCGVQAGLGFGTPVVTVRPFNHIGAGQPGGFVVPALAKRIVEATSRGAKLITVGNLSARRDFTDVRDVVRAYRQVAEVGTPGEAYNVCSGVAISIGELLERMLLLADAELEVHVDQDLFRKVDLPVLVGDPAKLRSLGWSPKVGLDDTLLGVIEECRRSG
ncbi:MAG: GDP-mannose 4,6-dehydratase [Acidimicrobiales bacterium]